MRDIEHDPTTESKYECPRCGTIVTATHHPGTCTDCHVHLRNRGTPLE
ncbi:rubrerythrin-like domain-containing protein [Haladaptatus sp. DYF46]|nr:rubrerythrin-like domain-containing protein [Haladaptatus sp. DYF46]